MSAPFLPMMTPGRAVSVARQRAGVRTFDDDTANASLRAFFLDEGLDRPRSRKIAVIFIICVPAAVPGTVDLSMRSGFAVTRYAYPQQRTKLSAQRTAILPKHYGHGRRVHRQFYPHRRFGDDQFINVEVVVVFCILQCGRRHFFTSAAIRFFG
jgi:hypothetical protein